MKIVEFTVHGNVSTEGDLAKSVHESVTIRASNLGDVTGVLLAFRVTEDDDEIWIKMVAEDADAYRIEESARDK